MSDSGTRTTALVDALTVQRNNAMTSNAQLVAELRVRDETIARLEAEGKALQQQIQKLTAKSAKTRGA